MRIMEKGERLPKHDNRIFDSIDGRYEWYHLVNVTLNDTPILVATYGKPRHKGAPRKIEEA